MLMLCPKILRLMKAKGTVSGSEARMIAG